MLWICEICDSRFVHMYINYTQLFLNIYSLTQLDKYRKQTNITATQLHLIMKIIMKTHDTETDRRQKETDKRNRMGNQVSTQKITVNWSD